MENKYWVARDLSGALFLTDNKPKRCDFEYGLWISKGENMMRVNGFPDLTWNDEPLEVKLQPVITDLDIKTNETTMEKELKIEVPQGYEIDRQKSTFEKIVFKKIPENPKTWEEYCKLTKGSCSNYTNATTNMVYKDRHTGSYNEFTTKERAKQFIALGKLLQLRDYWVGDLKSDLHGFVTTIYNFEGEIRSDSIPKERGSNYSLTFPTREMAQKFIECFKDLIKEACPLV